MHQRNHHSILLTLLLYLQSIVALARIIDPEFGTYLNPNPRKYPQCQANDLVKLSSCCNELLHKLDQCKSDDLACECCALQLIDRDCYHLCPGNPLTNFLTVLLQDCAQLSEINACALPFKKTDDLLVDKKEGTPNSKSAVQALEADEKYDASLKSKVHNKVDEIKSHVKQDQFLKKKIKLLIDKDETFAIQNHSNNSNNTISAKSESGSVCLTSSYLNSPIIILCAILTGTLFAMY